MNKTLVRNILLSAACTVLVGAVGYYVVLPPLNPQSETFWIALAVLLASFLVPFTFLQSADGGTTIVRNNGKTKQRPKAPLSLKLPPLTLLPIVLPVIVLIVGQIVSSTVFHAKAYSEIITVTEAVFEEDMPETDSVSNIALMDTETATVIGNRTLGSLASVVSQYGVGGQYSQINLGRTPKKVSHLEYLDFFKWANNRGAGIPGYVTVDPVKNTAEYKEFKAPMRYVESGYFMDDLARKLRFEYPTKIFGSVSFEIDEEGNPYYIVSCMKPQIAMFGAPDVEEVIIFDPTSGDSELFPVEETPAWIDCVYTGSLACQKYDWHGLLSGGFFNSIIGNVGCKVTTDDFGYIVIEDDVWYFTGVTSVTADESNIGFIISNARTGEYKFYPVVGAEEYSAMGAAEGEVQEKAYVASFPSLVNISGEATYIMVLKDANSIVKLYALVNVENYSIVATGATQEEVMVEYKRLLVQNGVIDESELETPPDDSVQTEIANTMVLNVREVTVDGNTVFYFECTDGMVYRGALKSDETLILIRGGSIVNFEVVPTEHDSIWEIRGWEFDPSAIP